MEPNIKIPMQTRQAALVPSSVNDESRTVDLIWTTGAQVRRSHWLDGDYTEELEVSGEAVRLGRLNGGAPVLNAHNKNSLDDVIGVVESARIEGGEGSATVRFAENDPDVDRIWNKVRTGILRAVSVGYHVHEFRETRKGQERHMLAVDWEPLEISLVPIGADAGAGVRANVSELPCTVTAGDGAKSKGDSMDDDIENPDPVATPPVAGSEGAERKSDASESQSVADALDKGMKRGAASALAIMDLCSLARAPEGTAADMIRRGITEDAARAELMAKRDAGIASGVEIQGQHQLTGGGDTADEGELARKMKARFDNRKDA